MAVGPESTRQPRSRTHRRTITMISRLPMVGVDGIRDYTLNLCRELMVRGIPVRVVTQQQGEWRTAWRGGPWALTTSDANVKADDDVVILQYNPFMYGRWGFAPKLILEALRIRRSPASRAHLLVMVHEPFMPFIGWRETLMGLWQRSQLRALAAVSDGVLTSVEEWASRFARWHPVRPTG